MINSRERLLRQLINSKRDSSVKCDKSGERLIGDKGDKLEERLLGDKDDKLGDKGDKPG